jgi:prepilin-type N-terminal cleavage/methylation domain-containing protein
MKTRGLTLIEIVFVLAILTILGTITVSVFKNANSRHALDKSAYLVVSVLNQARSLTLASKENTQYGVHFEQGNVTIFEGSSYSASSPTNMRTDLNSSIIISNINLGGPTNVIFERLTGKALQSGSVTLTPTASSTDSRVVNIYSTGISELN